MIPISAADVGKVVDNSGAARQATSNAGDGQREVDFPAPGTGQPSTGWRGLSTGRVTALCAALALLWLALSAAWLSQDHGLRDGDEEGHVGAAALFAEDLWAGDPRAYAARLWMGETGEYPGLYPAVLGGAWAALGQGQPGRLPLRLVNLGWLLLGASAAGALAARVVAPRRAGLARLLAFGAVLLSPEANGVARHFMPEGALLGWTTLATLSAARALERPSARRALELGVVLGLGALLKQTFALYALPAAVVGLVALRARAGWALAAALLLAGPWYAAHGAAQLAYGAASAPAEVAAPLHHHLLYYPVVLAWSGLGPPLLLALLAVFVRGLLSRPRVPPPRLALLAFGLGLLVLTAVPKKYPRLLVPLVPAAAVMIGAGLASSRRPGLHALAWGSAAAGWLGYTSWFELPPPGLVQAMESGCVQRWIRPPRPDDFGLPEVAAAAASSPGPVVVIAPPEIPCLVQTTAPWIEHLRPWLEREGLDREVLEAGRGAAASGIVVDWSSGPGQRVDVPPLGRAFWIRNGGAAAPAW